MKRWWLPTQKGSELWPRTTVQPPKLLVEGVKSGTPLYRAVAARFGGRLSRFHGKAQQAYALSPNEVMKLHQQWEDGRVSYANINGQEILRLEVNHRVLGEEAGKSTSHWDYALIELYVPSMYYSSGASVLEALAHLTAPQETAIVPGITWPVDGLATNFVNKDIADRVINAAESDSFVHSATYDGELAYASFIVDLRPARGLSAVTVDLHAQITIQREVPPSAIFFTPAGTPTSMVESPSLSLSDYNLVMGDTPTDPPIGSLNQTLNGGTLARITVTQAAGVTGYIAYGGATSSVDVSTGGSITYSGYPAVTLDEATQTWVFNATGTQFYNEYLGGTAAYIDNDPMSPTFGEVYTAEEDWWRHWYVASSGGDSGYTGPDLVPSEVQLTLFQGVPNLDVGQYTGSWGSFYRWDYRDLFPGRSGHMRIGGPGISTNLESRGTDPTLLYNVPKLGTVIIALEMDKGFAWQPA